MDIEGYFLAVGAPVLVTEAVGVLAVVLGVEAVVAVGDGLFVDLVLANGVCDLFRWEAWLVMTQSVDTRMRNPICLAIMISWCAPSRHI